MPQLNVVVVVLDDAVAERIVAVVEVEARVEEGTLLVLVDVLREVLVVRTLRGAVELVGVVIVVVVVPFVAHPSAVQASWQLGKRPTQALMLFGAVQRPAWDFIEQDVRPLRVVRQHVTNSGLPQVDLAAAPITTRLQSFGKTPSLTAA